MPRIRCLVYDTPVYDTPQNDEHINLITSCKTTLLPGETKVIKTVANGTGTAAKRPITEQVWMTEGLHDRENRSLIRVFPALNIIGTNNENVVQVQVTNTSQQNRSLGKGVKVAYAHKDFTDVENVEYNGSECINSINDCDVIKFLSDRKKLQHLTDHQYSQVKTLLTEYKDVFTIGNEKIGRAENSYFHINADEMTPVSIPLRRVPLHKEHVVEELLKKYIELGACQEEKPCK